jgi:hypothetical protein
MKCTITIEDAPDGMTNASLDFDPPLEDSTALTGAVILAGVAMEAITARVELAEARTQEVPTQSSVLSPQS